LRRRVLLAELESWPDAVPGENQVNVMRGKVLAAWRREMGWSQERLATELGVEPQMVDDLEHSPNITPLLEVVIATLRNALAAMRTVTPTPDEFASRPRPRVGMARARRR